MYASDSNFSLTCVTNRPRTCCETIRGDWVQTINGEFSIMPQRYCDATCFQLEYGGKWKFFVMTDTQFWRQVVLLSGKRIGNASTCYFPLRINSKKNKKKKTSIGLTMKGKPGVCFLWKRVRERHQTRFLH